MQIEQVKAYLISLQDSICAALAEEDGRADFLSDEWQREEGGGGRSRCPGGRTRTKSGPELSR